MDSSIANVMESEREDEVTFMIEECMEAWGLTKWEEGFLTNIQEWYQEKGFLTDKQMETLERIYNDKAS